MKTAIIKTTFWDDEEFESLNLDSKVLYFYLLANPTRTLHRITKINFKIASAHTGLSIEQLEIAKRGLIQQNLVIFKDRYYLLLKDYVEAKSGRFTKNVIEREEKEIPDEVKDYFENYTGTLPVYKDIYKDKDKDNDKKQKDNKDVFFEEFWKEYPEKKGKFKAKESYLKATKKVSPEILLEAIKKQKENNHFKGKDGINYIPHPTTWLNQGRWEDELKINKSEIITLG